MFFSKQQSSTDLHADVHNSGKLNASAKFRASHYRVRFALPAVPLIRNSIFARNVPFSQTWHNFRIYIIIIMYNYYIQNTMMINTV